MRLIVAITGASGVIYGKRLIEVLKEKGVEVHLILSKSAKIVVEHELGDLNAFEKKADFVYDSEDIKAPPTSGSFKVDGMIVIPATMKTVAAIASGYADNLIARAADVQIKERRPLILVPRETPLNAIHLDNMASLSRLGVVILPAMPAFYHRPSTIGDLVDFIVGKVLDQLGLEHDLYSPWKG